MVDGFMPRRTALMRSVLPFRLTNSNLPSGRMLAVSSSLTVERRLFMAVHHGGKVGKAAKTLATKSSTHKAKSKAGKTLAIHKAEQH